MKTNRKIAFLLLVFLLLCFVCDTYGQWRWSNHGWDTEAGFITRYDKVDHFLCSAVVYYSLRTIVKLNKFESWLVTTLLIVAWEVKDALFPWEKFGRAGGDGFCWKDLVAGEAGMITICSIDLFGG